jgi:TRAP-type C4-dicarboxylate transport system permease small subunit
MYTVMPIFCGIITVDVLLRYFFNAPIHGSSEILGILLMLIFFSACTKCEQENSQIQMELFYTNFSPRNKLIVDALGKLNGALLFGILSYTSITMVPEMIMTNETGTDYPWPLWPYRLFMAVMSTLCLLRLIVDFFKKIRILISGEYHG